MICGVFRIMSNIYDSYFFETSRQLKPVDYLRRKTSLLLPSMLLGADFQKALPGWKRCLWLGDGKNLRKPSAWGKTRVKMTSFNCLTRKCISQ